MVEQIEYNKEESKLITSEREKTWNETSPTSKLVQIKSKLDEPKRTKISMMGDLFYTEIVPYEEIEEIKNLINNSEYREFQKAIWMNIKDCDWKLWEITLDYLEIYIEKIINIYNAIQETQKEISSLWEQGDEEQKSTISEYEKTWNVTSPNSRLPQIKNRLNKTYRIRYFDCYAYKLKYKEIERLKGLINNYEYRKFQKAIWMDIKNCDWKLWPTTLDYLGIFIEKVIRAHSGEKDTEKEASSWEELDQNWKDRVKINRLAKEYLLNYETLSEEDYNTIFSWKEQLMQWQLGNCYLVSSINELTNAQYFDTLMRTSLCRVAFKDDWLSWSNIKIPLWEPNGRDILIKDSELDSASINWNIGFKLLEIAYAKNKRPNNKSWNVYSPVKELEMNAIWKWWYMDEVFKTFLGRNNIGFSNFWIARSDRNWKTLSLLSKNKKTEIINYLKNFDWKIWNKFTHLSTPRFKSWDDTFNVWWNTLYSNHAYALLSVEKDSNWDITCINVKNPRNSNKQWGSELSLTLPEFFEAFNYIWVWTIKVDRFLDNRWYT